MSVDAAALLASVPRATLAFRSLPLSERRAIVRDAVNPRDALPAYRHIGARRWTELGLPGGPGEHDLAWIESNVDPAQRRSAVACRLVGLCLVASNTFEILSGGLDRSGRRLVRMQTGSNDSGFASREETTQDEARAHRRREVFHLWLHSPVEGRIDLTEEQIDEFLPQVRHVDGVASGWTRLFRDGKYRLPAPLERYRVSEAYIPVLDRALSSLRTRRGLL